MINSATSQALAWEMFPTSQKTAIHFWTRCTMLSMVLISTTSMESAGTGKEIQPISRLLTWGANCMVNIYLQVEKSMNIRNSTRPRSIPHGSRDWEVATQIMEFQAASTLYQLLSTSIMKLWERHFMLTPSLSNHGRCAPRQIPLSNIPKMTVLLNGPTKNLEILQFAWCTSRETWTPLFQPLAQRDGSTVLVGMLPNNGNHIILRMIRSVDITRNCKVKWPWSLFTVLDIWSHRTREKLPTTFCSIGYSRDKNSRM